MKNDKIVKTVKDLQEILPEVPVFVVPHLHEHDLPKRPIQSEIDARKARLNAIKQSRNDKSGE